METTAHLERVDGFARALLDIARTEADADAFTGEFYAAAQALAADGALRDRLSDPAIPVSRRQAVVADLLDPRTGAVTVAAVNFVVASGMGRHLQAIASRLAKLAAEEQGSVVAEVRAAVSLDAEQVARLEAALSAATGRRVEAKVVVDPSVVGGVVTKIGDTVFDGSVRSRLDEIREQWG
jgi:F-type H+-transporting ATPase subunit delta